MIDYFKGREVFVLDGFAGADPAHRLPLRIVTEKAWHSLFARQLLRRPPWLEWRVTPHWKAAWIS
jgi:phosphoenolpyruvate carboxykinase (ATP)